MAVYVDDSSTHLVLGIPFRVVTAAGQPDRSPAHAGEGGGPRTAPRAIGDVSSPAATPPDLDALLERVSASARELCAAEGARVAVRDPGTGHVLFRPGPAARPGVLVYIEPGKGIGGHVLTSGQAVRTVDLVGDARFSAADREIVGGPGPVAVLVVPARVDDQIEALFYLHRRAGGPFSDREETILTTLADHVGTAIRNARLYNDVSRHQRVLEALTLQLVTAQEAERKRLAREIHDEVGQSLSAVKMSLGLLLEDVRSLDSSVQARVSTALHAIGDTLREVRRISSDLRPVALDTLGLDAALHGHVDRFMTLTGLVVEFYVEGRSRSLEPAVSLLLYRVAQEALTNVARHSGATRVWVGLRYRKALVELTITDDGCGFDAEAVMESGWKSGHFGLVGMRERVRQLGGIFVVSAAPEAGARLVAAVRYHGPGVLHVPSDKELP
jgi:signal transduction histidine kinase